MAPSTCSKPTCGTNTLMRRAERRDQMFGPKPEKRLVDSHKIDVIQQKSTTRHNMFELIRSSFVRPNANEIKLLRTRTQALQQREPWFLSSGGEGRARFLVTPVSCDPVLSVLSTQYQQKPIFRYSSKTTSPRASTRPSSQHMGAFCIKITRRQCAK